MIATLLTAAALAAADAGGVRLPDDHRLPYCFSWFDSDCTFVTVGELRAEGFEVREYAPGKYEAVGRGLRVTDQTGFEPIVMRMLRGRWAEETRRRMAAQGDAYRMPHCFSYFDSDCIPIATVGELRAAGFRLEVTGQNEFRLTGADGRVRTGYDELEPVFKRLWLKGEAQATRERMAREGDAYRIPYCYTAFGSDCFAIPTVAELRAKGWRVEVGDDNEFRLVDERGRVLTGSDEMKPVLTGEAPQPRAGLRRFADSLRSRIGF
ncbi:MAG: hypothetical protein HY553_21070 [Elusimicrobia bacterium]|nr:hypothetical protein [Elusimicrobiota bacterium]